MRCVRQHTEQRGHGPQPHAAQQAGRPQLPPPPPQAHACIGGKSVGDDIRKLEAGVHIVSGTPGRVFDMIKRRSLRTR